MLTFRTLSSEMNYRPNLIPAPHSGQNAKRLISPDIAEFHHQGDFVHKEKHVRNVQFGLRLSNLPLLPYDFTLIHQNKDTLQVTPNCTPFKASDKFLQAGEIVRGDIHGSTQALMETLLYTGIVYMPEAKQNELMEHLAEIDNILGQHTPNTHEALAPLSAEVKSTLVQHATQALALIQGKKFSKGDYSDSKLVLLGDDLADRKSFDPLNIALIQKLESEAFLGPDKLVRIASNHSHTVLALLFNQEFIPANFKRKPQRVASHLRSIELDQLWPTETITPLYREYFKKYKLLEYDQAHETLYTHAPVSADNVKRLITCMNQTVGTNFSYDELDKQTLPSFVDAANAWYRNYVDQVFETRTLNPIVEECLADVSTGFLAARHNFADGDISQLPFYGKGVTTFIHGHSSRAHDENPFSILSPAYQQGDYLIVGLNSPIHQTYAPATTSRPSLPVYIANR